MFRYLRTVGVLDPQGHLLPGKRLSSRLATGRIYRVEQQFHDRD
eukprot:COSAG02_NODE_27403_length_610_cov_1.291585_1_plen_43_part_01